MSTQCTVCLGKLGACDSCDRDGVCVRSDEHGVFCAKCRYDVPHAFEADDARDTAPPDSPERRAELAQDEVDTAKAMGVDDGEA